MQIGRNAAALHTPSLVLVRRALFPQLWVSKLYLCHPYQWSGKVNVATLRHACSCTCHHLILSLRVFLDNSCQEPSKEYVGRGAPTNEWFWRVRSEILGAIFFYRAGTTCTGRTVKTMDQVSRRLMWRVLRNKKLTTNAGKEIVLVMVLKLINGGIFASPNCCWFFWIQKDPCMAYLPTSRQTNTQKIIDCNKEKIQNMFSCDAAERYY